MEHVQAWLAEGSSIFMTCMLLDKQACPAHSRLATAVLFFNCVYLLKTRNRGAAVPHAWACLPCRTQIFGALAKWRVAVAPRASSRLDPPTRGGTAGVTGASTRLMAQQQGAELQLHQHGHHHQQQQPLQQPLQLPFQPIAADVSRQDVLAGSDLFDDGWWASLELQQEVQKDCEEAQAQELEVREQLEEEARHEEQVRRAEV